MNIENIIELAELAEECALAELAAFGNIGFEQGFGELGADENAAAWAVFFECPEYVPFELY